MAGGALYLGTYAQLAQEGVPRYLGTQVCTSVQRDITSSSSCAVKACQFSRPATDRAPPEASQAA